MALMPKRVKYRKSQRGNLKGNASQGNRVCFGEYGIQALQPAWVSARQIEASRIAAMHFLKHEGKVYIRVFPHKPISAQPQETRMGKGKGEPEYYAATVKPGTILFEVGGISRDKAKEALNRIAYKLPMRVRFVERKLYQA